jgi:glycosyltransferase involved in cell wall biosynthesis
MAVADGSLTSGDPAPEGVPRAATVTGTDGRPRLSVVVPTWNAVDTVGRGLESVLAERGVDLECVVVDDGSTDGTADVVEALARADPRIVLLRLPENAGVSNARNRGLGIARGDWIAFHDADDVMRPGGVAALMAPTDDPTVRAVIGQRVWTDGTRTWLSSVYDIPDIREPGRKSIASNPGLVYYVAVTGKAFHRSLLDGLEFEGRLLGDQAWTIQALLRAGDGIEVIGETVFEWWRPAPGAAVVGITATSRASARGAIEVARMAGKAYAEVATAIEATVDDDVAARTIERTYFERLVRSDLSGQVLHAVSRGDPDTARFFDAVAAFIRTVPAAIVGTSHDSIVHLLRPPATRWYALTRSGRRAYWRMFDAFAATDPGLATRSHWPALIAPAFAVAATNWPGARAAASAYLLGCSILVALWRRMGRLRGQAGDGHDDGPAPV